MPLRYIISDLDGTIADCEHRQHLVREQPKRWKEFFEACVDDRPVDHVIRLLRLYARHSDFEVAILSGRNEDVYWQTINWLSEHDVPYNTIFMRPSNDFRPDEELKAEIVTKVFGWSNIELVLDDRQKVVDMWRRNGVPCLQVAPGDF